MLSGASPDRRLLRGRRVLIIEGDDELFRALAEILTAAGCAVTDATKLGAGESCAEVSVWVLDRVVDVALVDADPSSKATRMWIRHLDDRGVPILITYDPARPLLVPASQSQRQLRKPFTEPELLDGLAAALSASAPRNWLRG